MSVIRVYEIAKKYGLTNEQVKNYLEDNGIFVKNHMSPLNVEQIRDLIKKLETKTNLVGHQNRTSLKKISVYGLFGNTNYHFDLQKDINIWVSENGVGKTTILNIIVAILNSDKKTLMSIDFSKIEITLSNNVTYTLDKTKTGKKIIDDTSAMVIFEEIRKCIPYSRYRRLIDKYKATKAIDFYEVRDLIERYYDRNEIYYKDEREREKSFAYYIMDELSSNDFSDVLYNIKKNIVEEPLFYPTYRRIEISLEKVFTGNNMRNSGDLIEYIGFGMADVKKRIDSLLEKMSQDAYNSYIEMSGAIINELLEMDSEQELVSATHKINTHKIEVIIKRIGEQRIGNVDKLIEFVNGKLKNSNEVFLRFYLGKLVKIYDSQKAIDDKLRKFADVCSKYLSGKVVKYDEAIPSLAVYNEMDEDGDTIDWDDLSSGEKQIVSIFSKVYLDVTTSSIFIIDEPEISLSIEWQKEFLKDIYSSGKIGLLIATTHSPFIFKNELREFTTEINIYKEEK